MLKIKYNLSILSFVFAMTLLVACKKNDEQTTPPVPVSEAEFKNRSVTPSFIKMGADFSNVGIFTLVSSEDAIPNSNGTKILLKSKRFTPS